MLYDYATKDKRAAAQAAKLAEAARAGVALPARKSGICPHDPLPGLRHHHLLLDGERAVFFTGWLSGLLGVGGGFIRMPALIYLIGCPTAIAVGATSSGSC